MSENSKEETIIIPGCIRSQTRRGKEAEDDSEVNEQLHQINWRSV